MVNSPKTPEKSNETPVIFGKSNLKSGVS